MFLNASSSHSTPGGSGKNQKRLRQEAKEMVRSLQASRSSLDGSTKSSGNDNLFHSSRNGSNASASSNSANRYKRNLVQRPHSPTALITSQQHTSSLKKTSTSTSESTSPDNSIINEDSWKINSKTAGTNSKRKQLYNKKNSDSRLHSNAFPGAENGQRGKYENGVWQAVNPSQQNDTFSK